jgi:capsular exopolysaccharide synthesis family protein
MELLQYWKVIQKSLWSVLLIVAVGLSSTAYYTLSQPTMYVSSATLLLNPSVPSSLVPYVQTQVAANLAESYTQLMRTRSFGESVVKELPFPMEPEDVGRAVTTRLEPNTLFYRISGTMLTPEQSEQLVSTALKVFLSGNVLQQSPQNTTSIQSEIRQWLENKLTYLGDQIKSYEEQIVALQAQPPSDARDDRILQLRGQMITLQEAETNTLLALAQLPDDSTRANSAMLIDQPLPGQPASNNLLRNLGLALAVALLIGVGLAFLRDYVDYTIHSPAHMEEVLQLSPLAALATIGSTSGRAYGYGYGRGRGRKSKQAGTTGANGTKESSVESAPLGKLGGHKLVTLEFPKSPDAESFRILRTNIQFTNVDHPIRTMVVTSSAPGEGKSFTASNLAVTMAQAGKRVILVDADLRKPGLHKLFALPNQVGFTNLVVGAPAVPEGVMQRVPGVDNLAVITSGPIPPNPSELLNSTQAAQVMEALAKRADMVIYDTPPAGVVTDPVILATRVDATVLVISASTTRRDIVGRVRQNLAKVGVDVVLPVLNRVKLKEMQGYYYYHYYGGAGSVTADEIKGSSNGHAPHVGRNGKHDISSEVGSQDSGVGGLGQQDEHTQSASRSRTS